MLVKLPKTGAILLSGDAVHIKSNWENRGVPSGNTDKDQTLASRVALQEFLKRTGAQLWIQHDLAAMEKQRKAPGYYD